MKITLMAMGREIATFSRSKFYIYRKGRIIRRIPEWLAWLLSFVSPDLVCCDIGEAEKFSITQGGNES